MTKQVYRGGYLAASHMPRDFQHIALNAFLRLLARQKYHAPAALMPARRSTNHSQVLLDASCICIPGAPRDPPVRGELEVIAWRDGLKGR